MDNHELPDKLIELCECKMVKNKKSFCSNAKRKLCKRYGLNTKLSNCARSMLSLPRSLLVSLLTYLVRGVVKDKLKLEGRWQNNEIMKKDVEKIVGYVTPYLPFVGLVSGGLQLVSQVVETVFDIPGRKFPDPREVERTTAQEQDQTGGWC